MTRTCPACGHRGDSGAFPLLPPRDTPPRHDGRRRRCPNCGHEGATWAFTPLDQIKRAANVRAEPAPQGHPMLPGLGETA